MMLLGDIVKVKVRTGFYQYDDDEQGWADRAHVISVNGKLWIQRYRDRDCWDWPQQVSEWSEMTISDIVEVSRMWYLGE